MSELENDNRASFVSKDDDSLAKDFITKNLAAVDDSPILPLDNLDDIDDPENVLDKEQVMPLTEHLEELRTRILSSLILWIGLSCTAYYFSTDMLEAVRNLAGDGFSFVYTNPTEAFMAFVKMSLLVGFVLVIPVVLYNVVVFVSPGLTRKERRWMQRLVPFSLILFLLGAAFAWFIALPIMWRFFLSFQGEGIKALWTIGDVVGFVTGVILLCGVMFQVPLIIIFATVLGIVHPNTLKNQRRGVYFASIVLAAVITPTPDAFTALVVVVPMIILYEISVLISSLLCKKPEGN